MMRDKKMLVVSAHAADFVWRAGGAIAKYIKGGAEVHVIVLSFGVRGESNHLWREEGQTREKVKAVRLDEVRQAAAVLGVEKLDCWDLDDYPMELDRALTDRLVVRIRQIRPDIVLTHDRKDAFNPDHDRVSDFVFQACVISNSAGVRLEGLPATRQMAIFGFEPHQTEISTFKPGMIIDISEAFEQKRRAMACFKAQSHLIEYYTMRASMRGNHARRISGNKEYRYAEAFASFFPAVGGAFF